MWARPSEHCLRAVTAGGPGLHGLSREYLNNAMPLDLTCIRKLHYHAALHAILGTPLNQGVSGCLNCTATSTSSTSGASFEGWICAWYRVVVRSVGAPGGRAWCGCRRRAAGSRHVLQPLWVDHRRQPAPIRTQGGMGVECRDLQAWAPGHQCVAPLHA